MEENSKKDIQKNEESQASEETVKKLSVELTPRTKLFHRLISVFTIISGVALAAVAVYGVYTGLFTSEDRILQAINSFGFWGPAVFFVIQIVQVVIPIIPGGLTIVVGVMAFGPYLGFVYNYVSIAIGSIIVFYLSKRYGMKLIQNLFPPKAYEKYEARLNSGKKFEIFFAIAILMPVAPDDLLCYLAGLTKMTYKKFIIIIITCKPLTIFAYSMGIKSILEWLTSLFA